MTSPEEEQAALAAQLIATADLGDFGGELDEGTRSAIREGLEQVRRGEFVPEAEIAALWKRHGL
jgi:predicted transcriptional regulator